MGNTRQRRPSHETERVEQHQPQLYDLDEQAPPASSSNAVVTQDSYSNRQGSGMEMPQEQGSRVRERDRVCEEHSEVVKRVKFDNQRHKRTSDEHDSNSTKRLKHDEDAKIMGTLARIFFTWSGCHWGIFARKDSENGQADRINRRLVI